MLRRICSVASIVLHLLRCICFAALHLLRYVASVALLDAPSSQNGNDIDVAKAKGVSGNGVSMTDVLGYGPEIRSHSYIGHYYIAHKYIDVLAIGIWCHLAGPLTSGAATGWQAHAHVYRHAYRHVYSHVHRHALDIDSAMHRWKALAEVAIMSAGMSVPIRQTWLADANVKGISDFGDSVVCACTHMRVHACALAHAHSCNGAMDGTEDRTARARVCMHIRFFCFRQAAGAKAGLSDCGKDFFLPKVASLNRVEYWE